MATINARKGPDANNKLVIIGWQAIIRKRGHPSQTRTFRTKRDAEAWAKVTESEMLRGVWLDRSEAESTTLGEALQRYADEISINKKGSAQELCRIRQWLERPISKRTLNTLRGKDFAAYVKSRLNEGVSPNTVRLELAIVGNLFTVAAREWGMESLVNPMRSIKLPAPAKGRNRRIQPGEWGALIAQLPYPHDHAVVLLVETAMRRGELSGMRWEDVQWTAPSILLQDTKNGESREVPLSRAALQILHDLGGTPEATGSVWKTMATHSFSQAFIRACDRASIEDLRLHALRHEAASRLFEKGLNPMQVAAITGHKTLQMLKRYTHLRAEDLAKMLG